MTRISSWLNCRLLCVSVAQWVLLPHSQQKRRGLVKDNRGHLLSVYFLWCSATKLCCQNTQGYPCALCCAWGPAHWGTFIAYWLHWEVPAFCQSLDTTAAAFEKGLVVAASLHNRAINLNWSSLVEHRKTFSTLRQWCCSPELHKIETDLRLS